MTGHGSSDPSTHGAPIRVALDMSATRLAGGGVARVSVQLADALDRRDDVDVVRVGDGDLVASGGWRRRMLVARTDLYWHPIRGRRTASVHGARVYHCLSPRAPLRRGSPPTVVTVYDLVMLRYPETMSRWNRIYSRATIRRVLAAADIIVASSRDGADDLDRLLGVDGKRVRVVPLGVDHAYFGAPATSMPLDQDYVLFVGTPEPRKNLARLLVAMEMVRKRGLDLKLVVAGSAGWGGVSVSGIPGVVHMGRVDDETLRSLYAHARCLALPSLHEGFGLPVLEAMAAGCPVVAARVGGLPEVCGGAAVMVDPLSVASIAGGIERAIAEGASLSARGRVHARGWGWDRTGAALVGVYRELV